MRAVYRSNGTKESSGKHTRNVRRKQNVKRERKRKQFAKNNGIKRQWRLFISRTKISSSLFVLLTFMILISSRSSERTS